MNKDEDGKTILILIIEKKNENIWCEIIIIILIMYKMK